MVTIFGSCRVNLGELNNGLNNAINYTHSTKEVIQEIHFLRGELSASSPYDVLLWRSAILAGIPISFRDFFKQLFDATRLFVVEICSLKKYMHNGYYLHHLAVDERFPFHAKTPSGIKYECVVQEQSRDEIEADLLQIRDMLAPRTVIFVSHFAMPELPKRCQLIGMLEGIAKKHDLELINPRIALQGHDASVLMTKDLGHYTDVGDRLWKSFLLNHVRARLASL